MDHAFRLSVPYASHRKKRFSLAIGISSGAEGSPRAKTHSVLREEVLGVQEQNGHLNEQNAALR